MPAEVIHKDRLGKVIKIGDFVAAANSSRLEVGTVSKLNPKMVQFRCISDNRWWHGRKINKYPDDMVIVEGPEVTIFLLKHSN